MARGPLASRSAIADSVPASAKSRAKSTDSLQPALPSATAYPNCLRLGSRHCPTGELRQRCPQLCVHFLPLGGSLLSLQRLPVNRGIEGQSARLFRSDVRVSPFHE